MSLVQLHLDRCDDNLPPPSYSQFRVSVFLFGGSQMEEDTRNPHSPTQLHHQYGADHFLSGAGVYSQFYIL